MFSIVKPLLVHVAKLDLQVSLELVRMYEFRYCIYFTGNTNKSFFFTFFTIGFDIFCPCAKPY